MTAPEKPAPVAPAPDAPVAPAGAEAVQAGAMRPARPAAAVSFAWSAWNTLAVVAACLSAGALLAWTHVQRPHRTVELLGGFTAARAARERINPNADSAASLRRLPGIGPARAKAILAYRQGRGGRAFADANDLTLVHGIGPGTAAKLTETGWLSFDDANGMASDAEVTKH